MNQEQPTEIKPVMPSEWAEALKSGKYNQGHGKLRQLYFEKESHCCIGVLCDLMGLEPHKSGFIVKFKDAPNRIQSHHMAGKIIFFSCMPEWLTRKDQEDFIQMNDVRGNSFEEIAAEIERRYSAESEK